MATGGGVPGYSPPVRGQVAARERARAMRLRLLQELREAMRAERPRRAPGVALFERVKRGIKASPRMSRTEAFLHYADENPD